MLKTLTGEAIYTVHEQNVAMYDQYIAHVLEVEEVWKAEYDVPSAIAKHKQMTGEGIQLQLTLNHHGKTIDCLAHIGVAQRQVHLCIG